jgi:hypothetical protein
MKILFLILMMSFLGQSAFGAAEGGGGAAAASEASAVKVPNYEQCNDFIRSHFLTIEDISCDELFSDTRLEITFSVPTKRLNLFSTLGFNIPKVNGNKKKAKKKTRVTLTYDEVNAALVAIKKIVPKRSKQRQNTFLGSGDADPAESGASSQQISCLFSQIIVSFMRSVRGKIDFDGINRGRFILEVGAGEGRFLDKLYEGENPFAKRVVASDGCQDKICSEQMADEFIKKQDILSQKNKGFVRNTYIRGLDILNLCCYLDECQSEFTRQHFPFIVALNVFDLFYDEELMEKLTAVYDYLPKGGQLMNISEYTLSPAIARRIVHTHKSKIPFLKRHSIHYLDPNEKNLQLVCNYLGRDNCQRESFESRLKSYQDFFIRSISSAKLSLGELPPQLEDSIKLSKVEKVSLLAYFTTYLDSIIGEDKTLTIARGKQFKVIENALTEVIHDGEYDNYIGMRSIRDKSQARMFKQYVVLEKM